MRGESTDLAVIHGASSTQRILGLAPPVNCALTIRTMHIWLWHECLVTMKEMDRGMPKGQGGDYITSTSRKLDIHSSRNKNSRTSSCADGLFCSAVPMTQSA